MIIDLYQDNRECFFWTKDEIKFFNETHPNSFKLYTTPPDIIDYRGDTLRIYRGFYEGMLGGTFNKDADCVIVVFHYGAIQKDTFRHFISMLRNYPEKKFILLGKNVEDYWLSDVTRTTDSLFKELSDMGNVKVIWDVAGVHYDNFYFEPKLTFHNYYNNTAFPGYMFINGSDIFHKLPKDYRIGIHLNKITDKGRDWLFNTYYGNDKKNLYFTSKQHRKDNSFVNEVVPKYEGGVTDNWYFDQFVELTIKSQMEVIYETFTTTAEHNWLLKWNEKTVKLLFLSKPFIHIDPVAHSLFKPNGLKPYRSLYTDELWDMYENYDSTILLNLNRSENNMWWSEALERNIEWLLNMDTMEWEFRIREANRIAKENREIIDGYIFNQSLYKYIYE